MTNRNIVAFAITLAALVTSFAVGRWDFALMFGGGGWAALIILWLLEKIDA
jgi:hypothetical protein